MQKTERDIAYIIELLIKLKSQTQKDTTKAEQEIFNLLSTETTLRSKRELIEKFIKENLPVIVDTDEVVPAFDKYWNEEQQKAFSTLVRRHQKALLRLSVRFVKDPDAAEDVVQEEPGAFRKRPR